MFLCLYWNDKEVRIYIYIGFILKRQKINEYIKFKEKIYRGKNICLVFKEKKE